MTASPSRPIGHVRTADVVLWKLLGKICQSSDNLTREDGTSFFEIAQKANVKSVTTVFPLAQANVALERLRSGAVVGAAVLVPSNYAKA